ncbi:MAG: excinuclease ABC subunit A, partial [Polyangiaceae bacterium]
TDEVRVAGTEQYLDARERLAQAGYRRLWVGGEARDLDDVRPSDALGGEGSGALSVVVDRLRLQDDDARRLGAAIEEAWRQGHGAASLHIDPAAPAAAGPAARRAGKKAKQPAAPSPAVPTRVRLVRGLACPRCAREFAPPRSGLFSYQSPVGACAPCRGFGRTIGIDWAKVVPDERRTLASGAIRPWSGSSTQWERRTLLKFCARRSIPTDAAWASLSEAQRQEIRDGEGSWHGGKYPGLAAWFKWLESRTYKMHVRVLLARYRAYDLCADCGGKRLSRESLLYRVGGLDLAAWHGLELREAHLRLRTLVTRTAQGEMARRILAERLAYLERVGLGYLTLDRQARTLSGGEAQRVSLTCALGTSLTGALFVLDEPTVGLHAADIAPLCEAMRELAGRGNAVLVVEHDPLVIRSADRVLELGPGSGREGGALVFDGAPEALAQRADLPTGRALARAAGDARVAAANGVHAAATAPRLATSAGAMTVVGARANNLREVTVSIPLGAVVVVTGASGSGKSTLVEEVVYRAIARARGYRDVDPPGPYRKLEGTAGSRR